MKHRIQATVAIKKRIRRGTLSAQLCNPRVSLISTSISKAQATTMATEGMESATMRTMTMISRTIIQQLLTLTIMPETRKVASRINPLVARGMISIRMINMVLHILSPATTSMIPIIHLLESTTKESQQ